MNQTEKDAAVAAATLDRDRAEERVAYAQEELDACKGILAHTQAALDAYLAIVVDPAPFLVGTLLYDAPGRRLHGLVVPLAQKVDLFMGSTNIGTAIVDRGAWSWPISATAKPGAYTVKARAYHRVGGRLEIDGWLDNTVTFTLGAAAPPDPPPIKPVSLDATGEVR